MRFLIPFASIVLLRGYCSGDGPVQFSRKIAFCRIPTFALPRATLMESLKHFAFSAKGSMEMNSYNHPAFSNENNYAVEE